MGTRRPKGMPSRRLGVISRAAFMRHKKLAGEGVLLEAARDSSGKVVSLEAISWAGRIGGRGEVTAG